MRRLAPYNLISQANSDTFKGFAFAMFLFLAFTLSVFTATSSAGPVILGTELNTNGHVEYMCLGLGCDGMPEFKLSDK